MAKTLRVTEQVRQEIVAKAIKEGRGSGFGMMNLAPKGQDILEKRGIRTQKEQELRGLLTTYKDDLYILFFIKGIDKKDYIVVWKIVTKQHRLYGGFTEGKYRGYVVR